MANKNLSMIAFVLSVVGVILAALDAFGIAVWLAASSWLLVAIVFGVWADFTKEK